jgi:hypothetical protein
MIHSAKGVPGVKMDRWTAAVKGPKHCALSLVGEPIMLVLLLFPRERAFERVFERAFSVRALSSLFFFCNDEHCVPA